MNKNIFDKTISYLESLQSQIGNNIYFDELPKEFAIEAKIEQKEKIIEQLKNDFKEEFNYYNKKINETINPKEIKGTAKSILIDTKVADDWSDASDLRDLNNGICECQRCDLGLTRTNFVFGVGNPNADIMIIGEAPGADEDAQGEPFVGRAGQLLTKIIEAINFKREDVFICNIIKCRPPANRRPTTFEVEQCEPYLKKQIELIKPKYILALGLTAADTLFKKPHKMGDIRGKVFLYLGIPTLITYHPAALLRNPNWKKPVWEDVQLLRKMYDNNLNDDTNS